MKDRIDKMMRRYGLNQSQFAQKVGIPKSAMSHIFSKNGRGGHFSQQTLDRIIYAFPDINMSWLRDGIGEMLSSNAVKQPTLNFSPSEPATVKRPTIETPKAITTETKNKSMPKFQYQHSSDIESKNDNSSEEKAGLSNTIIEDLESHSQGKKIKRIVIFYDDNTFTHYLPE